MLLDETVRWKYVGGETTCKTDNETGDETNGEMSSETCRRKIKNVLDLRVISTVRRES
jgi:hypothetical protein